MAVFPFVVHRTFIDGTTQIAASDMNDIEFYMAMLFAGFEHRDEFAGAAVNAFWTQVSLGTGTVISVVDDSAAGGRGALSLLNGSAGTREATVKSNVLNIGTADFIFRCRARRVSTALKLIVGIGDPGTTNPGVIFMMDAGSGFWKVSTTSSNGSVSTSTAVTHGTTYQTLAFIRHNGTLKFYIDGVEVYSEANTTNYSTVRLMLTQADNQNFETRIDNVDLWAS